MTANLTLDGILDALADAVASRVLAKVIGSDRPRTLYTTNKRGPHLPGKSRRWMLAHVKAMPGARRVGRDWEIAANDFDAWATAEDGRRCRLTGHARREAPIQVNSAEPVGDLAKRAARSLDAQGFRKTRG